MTHRFGFLLFDEFEDLDFFGPWEIFALWKQQFNGPSELVIVSETGNEVISAKNLRIQTDVSFEKCPALDYLLIPGGQGTRQEVNNSALIAFIKQRASICQQMLSVCTGAFLLQAAGLLQGKKATTHWASLQRLKKFSEIEVVEKRFVNDGNVWTSAGVSAGIDMALAFVAKIAGEKTAGDIQLYAEYYPRQKIYKKNNDYIPAYVE